MTADIVATHYRVGDDLAGAGTILAGSLGRQVGKRWLDAAAGQLELHNTDPDLVAFGLDGDDLVAIDLKGVRVAVIVIDTPSKAVVRKGKGNERITLSGRTLPALLERAVVYPSGGTGHVPKQVDREWNVFAPEYDTTAFDDYGGTIWQTPYDVGYVAVAKVYWPVPWADNMPANYPAPACPGCSTTPTEILWHSDEGWPGDTTTFPGGVPGNWGTAQAVVGSIYFRREPETITIPQDGLYVLYITADNFADVYGNGVHLGSCGTDGDPSTAGFASATIIQLQLSAGPFCFAAVASNAPGGTANPAGFAAALYIPGFPPTMIFQTDDQSGWVDLTYPDIFPGMTMGQKWNILFDEMQARGVCPYFTRGWTDLQDFNGNDWDVVNSSDRVGVDYLTALRDDSVTYLDWDIPADGYELRLYRKGEKGTYSGVSIVSPTNLVDLVHEIQAWRADSLLIDYQGTWAVRTTGDASREALLSLGSDYDLTEVYRQADASLDVFANPRPKVDLAYEPLTAKLARYVRLVVTARDPEGGDPYAHLAVVEVEVDSVNALTASSPDTTFGSQSPALAVDANFGTWWQPVAATVTPTLVIDRGVDAGPFDTVTITFYPSVTFVAIDYTLQLSADGTNWVTAVTVTGNASVTQTHSIAVDEVADDNDWPGLGFDTGDTVDVTDFEGTGTDTQTVQAWTILDSGKTGRALATITVGEDGTFDE